MITDWRRWGQKRNLWDKRRGQESREDNSVDKELFEIVGSGKPKTGSVLKETIAVFPARYEWACKVDTAESLLRDLPRSRMWNMHREPEVPEAEAPVVEMSSMAHARITSKEFAPLHSVKNGILQNACSTSQKKGCRFGEKVLLRTPPGWWTALAKGPKKNGDKSAVAILKNTRQLGCVYQDMEPPMSSSILRKSSNILKPIRCVRFTKARNTSC